MIRKEDIKEIIMAVLNEADYDLAKNYDPEVAEEPENCEEDMNRLVQIVEGLTVNYHHTDDIDPTV